MQRIQPPELPAGPATRFSYSYGVRAGSTVWISGQVAFGADGQIVGVDDVETQPTQVFENLKAVVQAAGGAWTTSSRHEPTWSTAPTPSPSTPSVSAT